MRERGLYRHTLVMAFMTALSRVLGYVRDRTIAYLLGTSYLADAFYIAFRIPNTFRRFVAEGAMTASLVPVLSQSFKQDSEERAWLFARRFFWVFGALLVLLGIVGVAASPLMVRLLAWEYASKAPQVYAMTIRLTAIIFPYITLVSLSAIAQGILNSRDIFGPPSFAPALMNIAMVAAAWFWGRGSANPAVVLAWGVLAGGLCQFGFLLPYLKKEGMSFAPAWSLADPHVRQVFTLMLPAMFGAGVSQVIILVGTAMGHMVGEGAVSALYYSNRITELAFGLFAVSLSTAVLPRMSRQAIEGDKAGLSATLEEALSMVFFDMLPATAGLLALSGPIVRVLLKTGSFNDESVAMTSGPLAAYSAGIAVWSLAIVLVRVCHAHRDMMTPFYAGLATLGAYVILGLAMLAPFKTTGIAAASSISAIVNLAWLAWAVSRKYGVKLPWAACGRALLRTGLLSLAMGLASWRIYYLLPHGALKASAVALGAAIAAGIVIYGGGAALFRFPEMTKAWGTLKRKMASREK